MPVIELKTSIRAPLNRCFDLARSVDFHIVTAGKTGETAVAGRISGLLEPGETVTWKAKHFGIWQELTVELTTFNRPDHFQDVMRQGAFAEMRHDHYFEASHEGTVMADRFLFRSPMGLLGAFVDAFVLKRYMQEFLINRAQILKATAESEAWKDYLPALHTSEAQPIMLYDRDKYQSRENRARVRKLFMEEWDPIGVKGCQGTEDEYNTYADKAYVMLMYEAATKDTITDYLFRIASDDMGLSASSGLAEASERTAKILVSMRPQFEANSNLYPSDQGF